MKTLAKLGASIATLIVASPVFADEPNPPSPAADAPQAAPPIQAAPKELAPAATNPPEPTAEIKPERSPWGFHGGINLRTDLGTHPLRLDGGVRYRQLDFILVLDPMYFLDQQSSTDILAEWRGKNGLSPVLGWRFNTIGLVDGTQLQHNLVLGGALDTPKFWDGRVRGQAGLELAMMMVKHGGGGPVETVSLLPFSRLS